MIDTAQLAIAITVYVFIGSLLMFIPSLLAWLAPNTFEKFLEEMQAWLMERNGSILAVNQNSCSASDQMGMFCVFPRVCYHCLIRRMS